MFTSQQVDGNQCFDELAAKEIEPCGNSFNAQVLELLAPSEV